MKTAILMGLVLLGAEPASAVQRPASGSDVVWNPLAQQGDQATDWREALSDEDLDRREQTYARLLREAQRDPRTRELLREWAGEQGPLGWTGRLALRELALRDDPFATDLPGGSWWGPRAGPPGWMGGDDPFGSGLLRDMEERLGALLDPSGGLPGGQVRQSESFQMESGPDGVRVEVTEQQGDETSTKTYEAESVEELYELHPELRGRLSVDSRGPGWDTGFRDLLDRLRARRGVSPLGAQRVPADKLGILMREPGQWSASVEGLDPETGLHVERVFPGTLAAELGLRANDILVSLNGRPLRSGADVQAVLSEREPTAPLTAEVVDSRGERRELRWVPPDPGLRRL